MQETCECQDCKYMWIKNNKKENNCPKCNSKNIKTKEICLTCNGKGINEDIEGNKGSCMTCNGKGYFEYYLKDKYNDI